MKVGRVLYSDLIMSTAGRLAVIVAIAVALVGGLFAAPLRYEVETAAGPLLASTAGS
jgi:hypothetical protein